MATPLLAQACNGVFSFARTDSCSEEQKNEIKFEKCMDFRRIVV